MNFENKNVFEDNFKKKAVANHLLDKTVQEQHYSWGIQFIHSNHVMVHEVKQYTQFVSQRYILKCIDR